MKHTLTYLSVFALALSGTALAQTSPTPATGTNQPAKTQSTQSMESTATSASGSDTKPSTSIQYENRASSLIGEEIENSQDEEIGEIDDLIISQDDKVLYAIVSVGGFLGLGERLVAVPYNDLIITQDHDDDGEVNIVYNANKEQLNNLPEFNYKEGEMAWSTRLGEEWNKLKGSTSSETENQTAPVAN